MNNKDYIAELAQQTGYSQDDTQKMVRKVIDAMIAEFEEGEMVSIPNFGTFEVVPPKLVLGFRPVAAVKEKLKNGGEAYE